MECFPHLEELTNHPGTNTDTKTIIRAFEQKWPLIYQERTFPPRYLSWEMRGDVKTILDYLVRHAPSDHFEQLDFQEGYFQEGYLRHQDALLAHLPQLLLAQRHWRDIEIELRKSDLSISDDLAAHLARLPRFQKLYMKARRLNLSANGLVDLLKHGDFEQLLLYETNSRWTKTPISSEVLKQLWRHPRRRTITLEHTLVTGLSTSEWIALARGWTSTQHVTFRCFVSSAECPTGTKWRRKSEPGTPFKIEGIVLSSDPSVAILSITMDPELFSPI
jgi:hypothetical protein